jgi:hypothetical protein
VKLCIELIAFDETTNKAKVHNDWSGGSCLCTVKLSTGGVLFSGVCWARAQRRQSLVSHINRRGWGQGCASLGFYRYISSHRKLLLKTPHSGDGLRISGSNVFTPYTSAQKKRIETLYSSKCATRQSTQYVI